MTDTIFEKNVFEVNYDDTDGSRTQLQSIAPQCPLWTKQTSTVSVFRTARGRNLNKLVASIQLNKPQSTWPSMLVNLSYDEA